MNKQEYIHWRARTKQNRKIEDVFFWSWLVGWVFSMVVLRSPFWVPVVLGSVVPRVYDDIRGRVKRKEAIEFVRRAIDAYQE